MAGLRRTLLVLALGTAIISRPAVAQHGSSVSLTHTVSVTVPPRVKVQVSASAPSAQSPAIASSRRETGGLALSVSATQPWTLSIASGAGKSQLQWSHDRSSGFANVSTRQATVASGGLSQIPAAATVFFRSAISTESSDRAATNGLDTLTLTVVAP